MNQAREEAVLFDDGWGIKNAAHGGRWTVWMEWTDQPAATIGHIVDVDMEGGRPRWGP